MKKAAMAITAAALAVSALAGTAAHGGHACAGYSVTAPVVGTRSDTRCSPVPMPSAFDTWRFVRWCGGVPPAGVSHCVWVDMHTPG